MKSSLWKGRFSERLMIMGTEDYEIQIVYEDTDIIVLEKPPGISSQPDKTGESDLTALIGRDVYVVHRLDKTVGGVIVYAKNKKSCAKLSAQNFVKKYYAVVCGSPKEDDMLTDCLLKNERLNISKVVQKNTPRSKEAVLYYKKLAETQAEADVLSLIEVTLKTGRHHQIRVQLANAGLPVWGDKKYNTGSVKGRTNVALWAHYVKFIHPENGKELEFDVTPRQYPFGLFQGCF